VSVTVNLAAYLRHYAADNENVTVNGNTIRECLDNLIEKYPNLRDQIFDKHDVLHNYVSIFVAGVIAYPDKLEKPVKERDTMHILYIIGGG
jgi:molybdopterin converting factor small subunit